MNCHLFEGNLSFLLVCFSGLFVFDDLQLHYFYHSVSEEGDLFLFNLLRIH